MINLDDLDNIKLTDEQKEKLRNNIEKHNLKMLNRIINTNYPTNSHFIDLSGKIFDYLHVDNYIGNDNTYMGYYWCTCKCGNKIIATGRSLKVGDTASCGCKHIKFLINRNITHNSTHSRLYSIYNLMKSRCYNLNNPHYNYYGGRGIKICDEWRNLEDGFINFRNWALENGYNDRLTIDRIDVDGNYCPENCRWVDNKMQVNNRTNNRYLQIERWVFPLSIWSEISGINYNTIKRRLKYKWSNYAAIFTPVNETIKNPIPIIDIPPEYEKYNKYDEWVQKGKIKPVEETIYKDCPYIEHK